MFNEAIDKASVEIEDYINLYEIMLYSLKHMNNFETINNVNNFRANKVNKEIESFLNENINNKIKYIINKYSNIEAENIVYNIKANDPKVKLFGEEFVKNNKDNCFLIINNDIFEIQEYFITNEEKRLKIKLIGQNKITNLSYLFHKCESLISFNTISNWDTSNIINMSHLFDGLSYFKALPDISKWNTSNVTDMNNMFSNCNNLSYLTDISIWNIKNVKNLSYMFFFSVLQNSKKTVNVFLERN